MERGNNTAERLCRLDKLKTPFVKKKTWLGMNFQENVEVKAREAQLCRLFIYIDFEWV